MLNYNCVIVVEYQVKFCFLLLIPQLLDVLFL